MTKETKEKVLSALRAPGNRGAISELARRANCTTVWVNRVLSGKDEDDDLLVLASELVAELAKAKSEKENTVLENLNRANQYLNLQMA